MSLENFCWWLHGVTQSRDTIAKHELDTIKLQLRHIIAGLQAKSFSLSAQGAEEKLVEQNLGLLAELDNPPPIPPVIRKEASDHTNRLDCDCWTCYHQRRRDGAFV